MCSDCVDLNRIECTRDCLSLCRAAGLKYKLAMQEGSLGVAMVLWPQLMRAKIHSLKQDAAVQSYPVLVAHLDGAMWKHCSSIHFRNNYMSKSVRGNHLSVVWCFQVRMYIALEVLEALVDLLEECNACGLAEPQAIVAKLKQESMLVMGAIRRPLPGAPIAESISCRYQLPSILCLWRLVCAL